MPRDEAAKAAEPNRPHDWTESTLGHGNKMCRRCYGTDLELAALGELEHCSVPAPLPKPANDEGLKA